MNVCECHIPAVRWSVIATATSSFLFLPLSGTKDPHSREESAQ